MKDAMLPMLNPGRLLASIRRDILQARGAGHPPPCRCGATFSSFRARKQHLATCDMKPKAVTS